METSLSRILLKKKTWKWRDIQPSVATHTRNSCSAFNPSKVHTHTHTHTQWTQWTHTHSEHTHTHTQEQWAAIYTVASGEQLGVRCLAQGHLVVVLRVERALYIHSPPTIPAGPRLEPATFRLGVRLSTIGPWLTVYLVVPSPSNIRKVEFTK